MKRTVLIIALVLAGAAGAEAQNWATVTASNITDLNQRKLAAGQLCFLGTDQNGAPINFMVGGGGMVLKRQFCSAVSSGAVTAFTVPNPALTSPAGVYYRVTVIDSASGQEVLRYTGVTFSGGTFNLDTYAPNPPGFTPAPLSGSAVTGNLGVTGNITASGTITGSNIPAVISGFQTVAFSATPTFNAAQASTFKITLTGNVSSSTLSGAAAGQPINIEVCQDATGGRTFVPPANVSGWVTIPGGANACILEDLVYDGSTALAVSAGSTELASPPPIGSTTPNTGNFTTLTATGLVKVGRLQASGSMPTCSVTGAGTGATCTMLSVATDSVGSMFLTAGTSPGSNGTITVTFTSALGTNGAFCFFQIGNGSGSWDARASIQPTSGLTTSINAKWDNNGVPLVSTSSYTISFLCAGR